jgi:[CysO sulfur-carrier protein]-S-L-cysteine hydrolase
LTQRGGTSGRNGIGVNQRPEGRTSRESSVAIRPAAYAPLVLVIRQDLVDAIVAHAREDHPDEACGVVAGPVGSDQPQRFIPMTNAERSPTFYRFDSMEQLRVWREMEDRDEAPVVIYHSHTATEAYPSRTDISYAAEPDAHYVLVSTRDPEAEELRSFRILEGQVDEEEVRVVPAYRE